MNTDSFSLTFDQPLALQLQKDITGEIYKAVKCPDIKILKESIRILVNKPTRRFSEIMADFDRLFDGPRAAAVTQ